MLIVKKIIQLSFRAYRMLSASRKANKLVTSSPPTEIETFSFDEFKTKTVNFTKSLQADQAGIKYYYSNNSSTPTLYSSVYACMILSLLGELENYDDNKKKHWAEYFDSFQDPHDGLFYDQAIKNDIYNDTDWWGARHLALHMIIAYSNLGMRPKFEFSFLKKYYDTTYIASWLNSFDWHGTSIGIDDVDNKIMNIGCLLQYQRDYWNDIDAGISVDFLKKYLREKINPNTGMWGGFNVKNPTQLSRMIQFAYHILPIFFYDNDYDVDHEKIIKNTLKTQNKLGGFAPHLNSSACEDIDSIDILIRLSSFTPHLKNDIDASLKKAFTWVLHNQMKDGGFVFKLYEAMTYGHKEMSNNKNESSLFPTWFRTLSLAYLTKYFCNTQFHIKKSPGLEQ